MPKEQLIKVVNAGGNVYNVFFTNNNKYIGLIYEEIDGEWTFAQSVEAMGIYWDRGILRALYEYLDELCKPMDDSVEAYFAKEHVSDGGDHEWW